MHARTFLVTTALVAATSVPTAGVALPLDPAQAAYAVVPVALKGAAPRSALAQPSPQDQPNAPAVMLVIDTSSSMAGNRLQQAQAALATAVDSLAPEQASGLRSYGGNCGDPGLLRVPIGSGNGPQLRAEIAALVAAGATPTPEALVAAASDLVGIAGPRAIILVSDGESTCGDPCATVAELEDEQGIDLTIHTVGFQAPDAAEVELTCIAREAGGMYFSVDDQQGLTSAIMAAASGDAQDTPLVSKTDGDKDDAKAPVGSVEAGAGGTADDASALLPLVLVGGAAMAAGIFALVRRRPRGQ